MSAGKQHGPPQDASRCLPDVERVSSVVRGYRQVSQEPEMGTERQKEREKARPRLGPQELPTKAFTKSAPSFHPVLTSNPKGKQKKEVHRTRQDWTQPPVRGSEEARSGEAATPYQSGFCSLTAICTAVFHWPLLSLRRRRRREYLCQSSSVMPGQQWVRGADGDKHLSLQLPLLSSCSPPNLSVPPFTCQTQTARAHWLMRKVSRIHLSTSTFFLWKISQS